MSIPFDKGVKKSKSIPVLSYLWRSWPLLLVMLLTNFVSRWPHAITWIPNGKDEWGNIFWQGLTIADLTGAFIYAPAGVCLLFWLLGLVINLYHRNTIEQDAHSGKYQEDWKLLSHEDRIRFTMYHRLVYAIIIGLIIAALAK